MSPLEFLKEEFGNAQRLLRETLRHDYGPAQSADYYDECAIRLNGIGNEIPGLAETDTKKISTYLAQLSSLNTFVSLIERSRLGEFSWPFAYELREIADILLTEEDHLTRVSLPPIVHVVAEGEGYRIFYEGQVPTASSRRRFVVIQFPPSLKHHVLLHSLFGHELGHSALFTKKTGAVLQKDVLKPLLASGPLKDLAAMNAWINSPTAPQEVRDELAAYRAKSGIQFVFSSNHYKSWLIELTCDFFGFLLFGPAFMAAHRAYLECNHPNAYEINVAQPTHPPFAVRHKFLVQLMDITGWRTPITGAADGEVHAAENEMLRFLLRDSYDAWSKVFDHAALRPGVHAVKRVFDAHNELGYAPINAADMKTLITRLTKGLPPILADIDGTGKPALTKVRISQTLYAGWVYWVGRKHLTKSADLDFFLTNRLCDQALLQERAIRFALAAQVP